MQPSRKVSVGGLGGAAGIIVTWILVTVGLDVPAEVGAAISTIMGFAAAYIVPERDQEP
jgi:putative flippase GtrA